MAPNPWVDTLEESGASIWDQLSPEEATTGGQEVLLESCQAWMLSGTPKEDFCVALQDSSQAPPRVFWLFQETAQVLSSCSRLLVGH